MKKLVISASSKLPKQINKWKIHFERNGYTVIDLPEPIEKDRFIELYPEVYKNFFQNIAKADTLFIMNEDKNGIEGYIGAAAFAELTFGLTQKLIYNKDIELVILKMPSKQVVCYDEISLWLELGWIKLYDDFKI